MSAKKAIVLLAHGSRDPQWAAPFYAITAALEQACPSHRVVLAFLEMGQPDLPGAFANLASSGLEQLTVFPLFLGVGKHLRTDLPDLVDKARQQHPTIAVTLLPALGEHPQFVSAVVALALNSLSTQSAEGPP